MNAAKPEPPPQEGKVRVLDLVLKDLKDRAEMGKKKYGTYLMTDNGRDALVDAYQEALDLVMYLRQTIEEQRTLKALSKASAQFIIDGIQRRSNEEKR